MKKITLFFIFLFIFNQSVFTQTRVTVGGLAACLAEEWLDDIIKFAIAKDMTSFQSYLDSQK